MAKLERYRSPSALRLVERVLESPALVAAVRELPPEALGKWIDSIGLEDSGEIVALASTAQLLGVFDEDLWSASRAGEDPRFDPKRFALWLEVLLEAGEAAVAQRLCELPLDFVTLCVARAVLVIDIDALGLELSEGGEGNDPLEKALENAPYEEWQQFRLISRDARSFDSVWAALLALDQNHHDVLQRVLERCAALASEYIDDEGGLYAVLTSDEMLENDARAERDDRRAESGYVAPSDARAFLELARRGELEEAERDPVTRAYFRELAPAPQRPSASPKRHVERLKRLLQSADSGKRTATKSLAQRPARRLDIALRELAATQPELYRERLDELGFLSNALIAGDARGGHRPRPVEAVEEAAEVCERGLRLMLEKTERSPLELVQTLHLDQLFRTGFRKS